MPSNPTHSQQKARANQAWLAVLTVNSLLTAPDDPKLRQAAHEDLAQDNASVESRSHYYFRLALLQLVWWSVNRVRNEVQAERFLAMTRATGGSPWRKLLGLTRSFDDLVDLIAHVTQAPIEQFPTSALLDACTAAVELVTDGQDAVGRWRTLASIATDAQQQVKARRDAP